MGCVEDDVWKESHSARVCVCVCLTQLRCGVCFQGQVDIGSELKKCTVSISELIPSPSCRRRRRGLGTLSVLKLETINKNYDTDRSQVLHAIFTRH